MKRILTILFTLLLFQNIGLCADSLYTTSNLTVFSENNKYGLKNDKNEIIVKPEYKKLIRLGQSSWIVQKKNRFGLIDCEGNYLVAPKYLHVERLFNKWVKLGNEKDYGIYDETGKIIVPPVYNSIEPLFGFRFLTYKDYKYGIYNSRGEKLLDNEYDYIYMPNPRTMRIKYEDKWYEIEKITNEEAIKLPEDTVKVSLDGETFKVTNIFINTGVGAGYSVVTATDYLLKIFSTISPAYEETIDDLMLSQGAETVSIFIKLSWIPKFPFVYAKKYYNNLITPNKGPLANVRNELKEQMK